jgi:aminoglycoside phosphotransferase (APT) family kinase protein
VHSDAGFHNILVEEGRIRAVLDWEFSHLGEAEEDLAYCRPVVETLMPWDAFVERYRQAGGSPVREERLRAYQIWRSLRNAACCALGLKAFNDGLNTDLRLAFAGRVLLRDFAADVEKQMDALYPASEINPLSKAS